MIKVPKLLAQGTIVALMGTAAAVLATTAASAYVVCNADGDCWRSAHRYVYPGIQVQFYDDKWDWKAHNYRWHDHEGDDSGYWSRDKWVVFHADADHHDADDHGDKDDHHDKD